MRAGQLSGCERSSEVNVYAPAGTHHEYSRLVIVERSDMGALVGAVVF